jgi:hypothetical protein
MLELIQSNSFGACILDLTGRSDVPSGGKKWCEILTVKLFYSSFNAISFFLCDMRKK